MEKSRLLCAVSACVMSLFTCQSFGAVISAGTILSDWTQLAAHPARNTSQGSWSQSGAELVGPNVGAIISDFSTSGGFSFSTTVKPNDDDTMGLLWGYQDNENNYRISWGADFGEDGVGAPVGQGFGATCSGSTAGPCDGFKVIKEVGGVSSVLYLNSVEPLPATSLYNISVDYDGVQFRIMASTGSTTLIDVLIADATFSTGRVGLHTFFNPSSRFTNVEFTASAVPIPAAVWLFGSGLIGLVGMARRKTA